MRARAHGRLRALSADAGQMCKPGDMLPAATLIEDQKPVPIHDIFKGAWCCVTGSIVVAAWAHRRVSGRAGKTGVLLGMPGACTAPRHAGVRRTSSRARIIASSSPLQGPSRRAARRRVLPARVLREHLARNGCIMRTSSTRRLAYHATLLRLVNVPADTRVCFRRTFLATWTAWTR